MKIYSLTLNDWVVVTGAQSKYLLKSNDYQVNVDEGRITIYDKDKTYIIRNIPWESITNFEDAGFASEQDTVDYIINVINARDLSAYSSKKLVVQRLSNGTTDNMVVDGSVTPESFVFSHANDIILTRLSLFMDGGQDANFTPTLFGDISALANGCLFNVAGQPFGLWKNNRDIALGAEVARTDFLTQTDRNLDAFVDLRGLFLPRGEEVEVLIQDDLTLLNIFQLTVSGYKTNV